MKMLLSNIPYKNHDAIAIYTFRDGYFIRVEFYPSVNGHELIMIHGVSRQEVALAPLNNYPRKLVVWESNV